MRLFVLFALTLGGLVATTDDASAIGRRNRRGNSCCNSCGGMAYSGGCGMSYMGAPAGGCCGGGMAAMYPTGATVGGCCGGTGTVMLPAGYVQMPGQNGTILPAGGTVPQPMTGR